jgi:CheY-like chemotaxis protein
MGALSYGRWEIVTAESASQAFDLLQNQPVDLAVLDVQMGVLQDAARSGGPVNDAPHD